MIHRQWMLLLGFLLLVGSLIGLYAGDAALRNGRFVPIPLPDQAISLAGTYYPGTTPVGLLILEGFGSDQVAMRPIASEFAQAGVHVFTFDFAGNGRSPGGIGFDNAQTDAQARQLLAALTTFRAVSGLEMAQIILIGHSLGARVAMQAMTMTEAAPRGLILLGAQVNLATNQQAEVFTGVSDAALSWVQQLGPSQPAADVLLITGAWDDILTPVSAELLQTQLMGEGASNFTRDLVVFERLVHNYEIYSPRVLSLAKLWAAERWGVAMPNDAPTASRRINLWFTGLAGLFLLLFGSWRWLAARQKASGSHRAEVAASWPLKIVDVRKFLLAKLLFWLLAVPFIALVGGVMFVVPLGLPAFNLYYVACLGGYGLLLGLFYWRGWMPGTQGRLSIRRHSSASFLMDGSFWPATGMGAGMMLVTAVFAHTGLHGYLLGPRLLWMVIFTPFTALGFAIGYREMQMVYRDSNKQVGALVLTAVIGIIPFFFYTLFLGVLGSISGMLSGFIGLLTLLLVVLTGLLIQQVGGRLWVTAVWQSLLLYWLVLAEGPLFILG